VTGVEAVLTGVIARLDQKGKAGSVYIVTLRSAVVLLLPELKETKVREMNTILTLVRNVKFPQLRKEK
jgi:hypothetical protein